MNLDWSNKAKDFYKTAKELLLIDTKHREWGARPLRRNIQDLVENPISELFINGKFKDLPGTILVKASKGEFQFSQVFKNKSIIVEGSVSANKQLELKIRDPELWSPDNPNLYDLKLTLTNLKGKKIDQIDSYFGMRKISLGDHKGVKYLFLNNKPLFHYGTLDQGWWPDGLLTPPSDEAMRYDIEITKAMGFNMIRKHVKIEPDRWYFHCDQLGIMVWQEFMFACSMYPADDSFLESVDKKIYIIFELPNYKLRVGNFLNRKEAESFQKKIVRLGYRTAWVVPTMIEKDD